MQKESLIAGGGQKPKPNRVDAYVCPDLHTTITAIREGTPEKKFVPPTVNCISCGQPAQSLKFRVNQLLKPVIEWYMPTPDEVKAATLNMDKAQFNGMTDWLQKGGLLSRLLTSEDKTTLKIEKNDGV